MSDEVGDPAAFPRTYKEGNEGMTLRDYFAAKVLAAMLPNAVHLNEPSKPIDMRRQAADVWSDNAYYIADAMLKARTKG